MCEGKKCAKLWRKDATHQPRFAHAQHHCWLYARGEQLECFNVVAHTARTPCDLCHGARISLRHSRPLPEKCRRSTFKVMRAQDQSRAHRTHLTRVFDTEFQFLSHIRAALHIREFKVNIGRRHFAARGAKCL